MCIKTLKEEIKKIIIFKMLQSILKVENICNKFKKYDFWKRQKLESSVKEIKTEKKKI